MGAVLASQASGWTWTHAQPRRKTLRASYAHEIESSCQDSAMFLFVAGGGTHMQVPHSCRMVACQTSLRPLEGSFAFAVLAEHCILSRMELARQESNAEHYADNADALWGTVGKKPNGLAKKPSKKQA